MLALRPYLPRLISKTDFCALRQNYSSNRKNGGSKMFGHSFDVDNLEDIERLESFTNISASNKSPVNHRSLDQLGTSISSEMDNGGSHVNHDYNQLYKTSFDEFKKSQDWSEENDSHGSRCSASGCIHLGPTAARKIRENSIKKGDVLTVAELAGVMAAKRTHELVPHVLSRQLHKVDVKCHLVEEEMLVNVRSHVVSDSSHFPHMEALTGVSVACLTIYDMCKAVDKAMVIGTIKLESENS